MGMTLKTKKQIVKQFDEYLAENGFQPGSRQKYCKAAAMWLSFDAPLDVEYARDWAMVNDALGGSGMEQLKGILQLIDFLTDRDVRHRPTKVCDGDCFECTHPDCMVNP